MQTPPIECLEAVYGLFLLTFAMAFPAWIGVYQIRIASFKIGFKRRDEKTYKAVLFLGFIHLWFKR